MNLFIGTGRLTADPRISYYGANNDKKLVRYTLACDRNVRRDPNNPEQQTADFISCICYDKTADFADQYLRKGVKILVEGRVQTGKYENKEGQTVYTTDVVVSRHEFCESKSTSSNQAEQQSHSAPTQQTAPATAAAQPTATAPATVIAQPMSQEQPFINIPDGVNVEIPFT